MIYLSIYIEILANDAHVLRVLNNENSNIASNNNIWEYGESENKHAHISEISSNFIFLSIN